MSATYWSWPNQQLVREDQSGPGVPDDNPDPPLADPLAAMTKNDLLAEAEARGIEADATMTKAQIIEAIEAAG